MTEKKKNDSKETKEDLKNKIKELQDSLDQCSKERDEYLDGWKRAKADYLNYKNSEDERFKDLKQRGQEKIIQELIITLDHLDLGILSSDDEKVEKKGITLIRNQLSNTLKKYGLEKIEVEPEDGFNPELHEAISTQESKQPKDTIIEIIEPGYTLNGRVIRPTKVKVSK